MTYSNANKGLSRYERYLLIAAIAASLLPVWGVYFPPLLDFPEHVLLTHVLAESFRQGASHYEAGAAYDQASEGSSGAAQMQGSQQKPGSRQMEIRPLWLPYRFFYFLAVPLARLMPAMWAVRVVLSTAVIACALLLRWLLNAWHRDRFAFYLAYPFLFSSIFLSGVLPYLTGVPFAPLLIGLVARNPRTTLRNFVPRLALMLAIMWAHPVLYIATAAMLSAALFLGLPWRGESGSVSRAVLQRLAALAWLAAPGAALALLLPSLDVSRQVSWSFKLRRLNDFFMNLGAAQPRWLILAPLCAWLLWVAFEEVRGRSARSAQAAASAPNEASESAAAGMSQQTAAELSTASVRALGLIVLGALLLVFALPEETGGQLFGASFRVAPLALILACVLLPARFTRTPVARALLVVWCFGVFTANFVLARRFDSQMRPFMQIVRLMEPGQPVTLIVEGGSNLLFYRSLSYYHLLKGGVSPQNSLTMPGIRHLPAALPPPFPWGSVDWEKHPIGPLADPGGRVFRYVVLKTEATNVERIERVSPPYHRLVAVAGTWLLFERRER